MTGHDQLGAYDEIKASGSSEDSCYGSNDLSRSSSSAHGVSRPLLTQKDRSSSLSSTSVEYAVPVPRHNKPTNIIMHQSTSNPEDNLPSNHLKTFHSPSHYNLKKTVQSLTRRPIIALQPTYLTYDSIDIPPNHASPTSTSSREYSI